MEKKPETTRDRKRVEELKLKDGGLLDKSVRRAIVSASDMEREREHSQNPA